MQRHIVDGSAGTPHVTRMLEAAANRLAVSSSVKEAFSIAVRTAGDLGFEHLVYLLAEPAKGPNGITAHSNLPDWWTGYYHDSGQVANDPFFKTCRSFQPMKLGSEYLDMNARMLSSREQVFIKEAAETGLRSGFSAPVALLGSRLSGGWNFGTSLARSSFETHFREHGPAMQLLGFYTHERMQALTVDVGATTVGTTAEGNPSNSDMFYLSPREKDCLLWLARGLRTRQIAEKLRISEATVEFHFKSARRRLHAGTREHALARAISLNLICP